MPEAKELKPGDPCPNCANELKLDPRQLPDTLIDRHKRNADRPDVASRYAEQVRAKADEFGLIHTCGTCGYQARFQVKRSKKEAA